VSIFVEEIGSTKMMRDIIILEKILTSDKQTIVLLKTLFEMEEHSSIF